MKSNHGQKPSQRQTGGLRDTHFDNARLARVGAEAMRLAELRSRVAPARLLVPERVEFFMLMLIEKGAGTHMVDFIERPISPDTLVFVRPGQVQQWRGGKLDGHILLAAPHALDLAGAATPSKDAHLLGLEDWPAVAVLDARTRMALAADMTRLRASLDEFDGNEIDAALIHHELLALLLRAARWRTSRHLEPSGSGSDATIYRVFKAELEKSFRERTSARDYAARLGYSESTLARACERAEGRSPKLVIDRRVTLEAQRLLAHSNASVAAIGHGLGFSEATNFVKFFVRMAGMPPVAFRQTMAAPARRG